MLHQDFRFEVQARAHPQIFVVRPGVTIAAAVRTAPVGVEAVAERNVRAVVFGDDRLRIVGQIFRRTMALLIEKLFVVLDLLEINFDMAPFEAIGHIESRAATFRRGSR